MYFDTLFEPVMMGGEHTEVSIFNVYIHHQWFKCKLTNWFCFLFALLIITEWKIWFSMGSGSGSRTQQGGAGVGTSEYYLEPNIGYDLLILDTCIWFRFCAPKWDVHIVTLGIHTRANSLCSIIAWARLYKMNSPVCRSCYFYNSR